jgi:hypothetical protein
MADHTGHCNPAGEHFQNACGILDDLQMIYGLRNAEKAPPARVRKSIEENRSALA